MNKNSTGRVELKSMLKISLSCLSGNIKEKWPTYKRRIDMDDFTVIWLRDGEVTTTLIYLLFSSQTNSMVDHGTKNTYSGSNLMQDHVWTFFRRTRKKNQLELLQYLFVAADAILEVWYYVRNLDRSYDKLARLPGFFLLPALWFSFSL